MTFSRPDTDFIELPKYAYIYMEQVIGEYKALFSAKPDALADEIIERYRSNKPPKWADLYALEWILVNQEGKEALLARRLALKTRYEALTGVAGQKFKPLETNALAPDILADVAATLRELHRLMAVAACRERLRKRRLGLLAISVAVGVVVLLCFLVPKFGWWVILVPLMGALGGFVSSQRKVQSVPNLGESLADLTNLYFYRASMFASAVSGAAFAIVLSMIFVGGLATGTLFPQNLGSCAPAPLELAKLLTWSFIAGFAERFVPDTLDRLASKSAKDK